MIYVLALILALVAIILGIRVPTCVGREDAWRIRHQGALCRPHLFHQLKKIFRRITFNVEFDVDRVRDFKDVGAANVPLVWPWMHGDAIRAKRDTVDGGLPDIWIVAAPGIAQGGEFIDVDAE